MSSILDLIGQQLDAGTLQRMGSQIGATPQQTAAAVEAALPTMLGALQRNATSPDGAASLLGALDRDHDGSILDDLAGFLGQGPSNADVRSLDHIFGGRRGTVENAVARRSGLDGGQVMKLLAMLAPLVLGALSRARQSSPRSGGGSGGGLGDLLGGALGRMQQNQPGLGGMLGGLLDSDGDGSMLDDLLEKGLGGGNQPSSGSDLGGLGGLLGGLLGGKR
ncbi:MAG: hypothetical protein AMXMBFR36_03460 [Acidobacteriota bacterium]